MSKTIGTHAGDPGIYYALRPTLLFGMLFGLVPLRNATSRDSASLAFRWRCPQTIYSLIVLSSLVFVTTLCNVQNVMFLVYDNTFTKVALRLGGPLFYTSACISLSLMLNATRHIPHIFRDWDQLALRLLKYNNFSTHNANHHRISVTKATLIAICFMSSAIFEHTIHDINLFTSNDCGNITSFVDCNLEHNSDFVTVLLGRSRPAMVIVYILNKYANIAWNYHDLFVIELSFAFCQNFRIIVEHLKMSERQVRTQKEWRHLREDHLAFCEMVAKVDNFVAPIVLLSYVVNVYFVANQLFLGIRPKRGDLLEITYIVASFGHLVGRLCFVTFSAASLYDTVREPLEHLYKCPSLSYNHEVQRFSTQIIFNSVGFTGCKLFVINKNCFLAIVSLIFTYELLLLDVS